MPGKAFFTARRRSSSFCFGKRPLIFCTFKSRATTTCVSPLQGFFQNKPVAGMELVEGAEDEDAHEESLSLIAYSL